jgi:beta-glucanase (GH16 family)
MKRLCTMLAALFCLSACQSGAEEPQPLPTPVWSDEFDGDALNLDNWTAMRGTGPEEGFPVQWGNNELQFYRAENAVVRDGQLAIQIKREDFGGMSYTSSRLTTTGKFAFAYGRVEAQMKLPTGTEGLWPALFLLPDGEPSDWRYGGWAASGELDVLEYRSRLPGEVSGAAHFGGAWPANLWESASYTFPEGTDAGAWHIYALDWSPEALIWYVDGIEFFRLDDWHSIANEQLYAKPAPFDTEFCLVVNAAVGGTFDGGREPDADFTEAEVLVDWIRVYQ